MEEKGGVPLLFFVYRLITTYYLLVSLGFLGMMKDGFGSFFNRSVVFFYCCLAAEGGRVEYHEHSTRVRVYLPTLCHGCERGE